MKNWKKRGFTVVELAVVIGIIGVLIVLLLPTFSGLIRKAKTSNDLRLLRELNTALAADGNTHSTMADALDAVAALGYGPEQINDAYNQILWDSVNDVFCYHDGESYCYLSDAQAQSDVDYWIIAPEVSTIYSTYLYGFAGTEVYATDVGVDTSACDGVTAVFCAGTKALCISIRTNEEATLTVDAPSATVKHYGYTQSVTVCWAYRYMEYGTVGYLSVQADGIYIAPDAVVYGGYAVGPVEAETEIAWDERGNESLDQALEDYQQQLASGHRYGMWYEAVPATCTEDGQLRRDCADCGKSQTRTISATGHSYTQTVIPPTYTSRGYTAYTCPCGDSYYSDYTDPITSENLAFTPATDGTGYVLTGLGTCTDTTVAVPASYEGLPVIRVGSNAFEGNTDIVAVILPDSVTAIGTLAFHNCTALSSVQLPDSIASIEQKAFAGTALYSEQANWSEGVLYIGNHLIAAQGLSGSYTVRAGTKSIAGYAFDGSTELTSITLPESLTGIGDYAFKNCTALAQISLSAERVQVGSKAFSTTAYYENDENWSDGVLYLGHALIGANKSITSCTIRAGTTSIAAQAFYGCTALETVSIPAQLEIIGARAFYGCKALGQIDFGGTVAQWEAVEKGTSWAYRTDDPVICCTDGETTV